MRYTIYNKDTGEILWNVTCTEDELKNYVITDTEYIEGNYSSQDYIIISGIPTLKRKDLVLEKAEQVRSIVKQKLFETDWTDTYSAPNRLGLEKYNAWQTYRQQLRDISNQPGFPEQVVWPQSPQ